MQKIILILFLITGMQSFCQKPNKEAIKIFNRALINQNGKKVISTVSFNLSGIYNYQGHYSKPFDSVPVKFNGVYLYDLISGEYSRIDTFIQGNHLWTTTTIVKNNNVFYLDSDEKIPSNLSLEDISKYKDQLLQFSPNLILMMAMNYKNSFQVKAKNKMDYLISFIDSSNKTKVLCINRKTFILDKFVKTEPDDIFGEITREISFSGYNLDSFAKVPQYIRVSTTENSNEYDLKVSSYSINNILNKNQKEIPNSYKLSLTKIPEPINISFNKITNDIFLLGCKELNESLLVSEFDNYLMVFDAPGNINYGEAFINKINEEIPQKPIKYIFVSHYHPGGLGGLRAFLKLGCTVVTTKGNEKYIELLGRDILKNQPIPHPLKFQFVDSNRTFSDAHHIVKVYDIGPFTHHTDEYLIFYFPENKLLFENDLGTFPNSNQINTPTIRTKGLYQGILNSKIDVENIIQSWPIRYSVMIPFERLKKLVEN